MNTDRVWTIDTRVYIHFETVPFIYIVALVILSFFWIVWHNNMSYVTFEPKYAAFQSTTHKIKAHTVDTITFFSFHIRSSVHRDVVKKMYFNDDMGLKLTRDRCFVSSNV